MSVKQFRLPPFSKYHFSNKSSPLGDNSMESLLVELVSLPQDTLDSIIKVSGKSLEYNMDYIVKNYSMIAKACPGYNSCIDNLVKRFSTSYDFSVGFDRFNTSDPFFKFLGNYTRKIVSFAEYEGKTRIIALIDY